MNYELNVIIVNHENKSFNMYERDLAEFGYNIFYCKADISDIFTKAIKTNCNVILLSYNDLAEKDDFLVILDKFKDLDKRPLILNIPTTPNIRLDNMIDNIDFVYNIFHTGEKRCIILDIERNENYRKMSCEELFFLLKQKVLYDCHYIGLNASHEGFRWISESVLLITADLNYRKNFSAGVYKVLGNKYNATYTQIEPAIRRCMTDQYNRMDPIIKTYYFDLDINSKQRYTATHFINKIAENIKIQYKRNYQAFINCADNDKRKVLKEYFKLC